MEMFSLKVIGIFAFLHYAESSGNQHTPLGYMTHYYFGRRQVQVNDSLVLELTNRFLPDDRKDFLTCDVKVVTSQKRRILVHFMSLEISEDDLDRIHVYDVRSDGTENRISPIQGLYGVYDKYYSGFNGGVQDFISTQNQLKLDYQGKPTLTYSGFRILLTSFKEPQGECGHGFTRCVRKNICIPTSTRCDGYQNCGNNDNSDEEGCNVGPADTWNPWDGRITAIIVSAVACCLFILTAGIIFFVVTRINKRTIINTNISVEFRKRKKPKARLTNREHLTRLYAPPSYEVVVGMDEEPPPYEAVEDDSDTETDEEDGILREQVTRGNDCACVPVPLSSIPNGEMEETRFTRSIEPRVTSVLVTCDVDGNNISAVPSDTNDYVDQDKSAEFQNLTKYKPIPLQSNMTEDKYSNTKTSNGLCAQDETSLPTEGDLEASKSFDKTANVVDDVSPTSKMSNGITHKSVHEANHKLANGTGHNHCIKNNALANGAAHRGSNGWAVSENQNTRIPDKQMTTDTCNGHLNVTYKRSPSRREADVIEYADSD